LDRVHERHLPAGIAVALLQLDFLDESARILGDPRSTIKKG
jgi:hypothetical protein